MLTQKNLIGFLAFIFLWLAGCDGASHSETGSCHPNGTVSMQVERLYEETSPSNKDGFVRYDLAGPGDSNRRVVRARGHRTLRRDGQLYEQAIAEAMLLKNDTSDSLRTLEINNETLEVVMHQLHGKATAPVEQRGYSKIRRLDVDSFFYRRADYVLELTQSPAEKNANMAFLKKTFEHGGIIVCTGKMTGSVVIPTNQATPATRSFQQSIEMDVYVRF